MKLHKLTLENVTSLRGRHVVDFDDALGGAGIFLLHGPMGAGKTTLLDAICLALFGGTPRLPPGARGRNASGIKDGAGEAGAARVMSHGEHACRVEFEFSLADAAGGRQRYRAGWAVHRANQSPDGNFQTPVRKLARLENGAWKTLVESTKQIDFDPHFQAVLRGLSFEDFQRTGLLAQFAFREFLDAKPDERTALLERMTSSEEYRRIGQAAAQARRDAETAVEKLTARLSGLRTLSEEERAALDGELTAARAEVARLDVALDELRAAGAYWKGLEKAEEALDAAKTEHDRVAEACREARPELDALADDARMAPAREALRAWRGAAALAEEAERRRDAIATHHAQAVVAEHEQASRAEAAATTQARAEAERTARTPEIDRAVAAWHDVKSADEAASEAKREQRRRLAEAHDAGQELARRADDERQLASELAATEEALLALPARAALLEEAPKITLLSHQLEEARQKLATQEAQVAKANDAYARHAAGSSALEEAATEAERCAGEAGRAHEEARSRLAARLLDPETGAPRTLEETRAALVEREQDARRILEVLGRFGVERRRAADRATALANQEAEARRERETAKELAMSLVAAETTQRHLEDAFPALEAARTQLLARRTLIEHRSALEADHACPVCGSEEHPYRLRPELAPGTADAERQLVECEAALETARAAKKEADLRVSALGSQLAATTTRADIAEGHLSRDRDALDAGRRQVAELAAEAGLDRDAEDTAAEARRVALEALARESKSAWQELGRDDAAERAAATTASRANEEATKARTAVERHDAEGKRLHDQLRMMATSATSTKTGVEATEAKLAEHVASTGVVAPSLTEAVVEVARRATEARRLEARHAELAPKVAAAREALGAATTASTKAAEGAREAEALLRAREAHGSEALARASALLEGERPEAVRARLEQAVGEAASAAQAAAKELAKRRSELDRARTQLEEREGQLGTARTEALEGRARLDAVRAEVGAESDAAIEARSLSDADRAKAEALRSRLEKSTVAAQTRLEVATKALDAQRATRPEREPEEARPKLRVVELELEGQRMADAQRAASARFHECDAQRKSDDEARRLLATEQDELERLRADLTAWTQIHDVIGVNEGQSFAKVVQSLHLGHVLEHANRQLAHFMPRYRLQQIEHPEHGLILDFRVVDLDQQGVARTSRSLSGGESFVVSLALALGLAATRGARLQLETLLIDEGFGSLDPATLNHVLASLEALQSALGVTIGLISHVELLKEVIPAQIVVRPLGAGRSTLEVPNARR